MIHNSLTDHQIADAFSDTLSLIYRKKLAEINEELQPTYNVLDSIEIPQVSDFTRWFVKKCFMTDPRTRMLFNSIDHINKIRRMKRMPQTEGLDIERAKSVPIETLYNFVRKGKNVSCPFHGADKSPSMSLRYNRFYCFTCSAKGSTIDFIMRLNNLKFKEAVEYLNKL